MNLITDFHMLEIGKLNKNNGMRTLSLDVIQTNRFIYNIVFSTYTKLHPILDNCLHCAQKKYSNGVGFVLFAYKHLMNVQYFEGEL